MNKIEGQNEVFKLIKDKFNSQGSISEKDIYDILINYGFTSEEKQITKRKNLLDLKGETRERGIIIDDENISFVPFASYDASNEELETAIKMYIPVDAKHLKDTCDYFSKKIKENNIKSNSKARNRVTSDDIVVRVFDVKSAEDIKNIVKKSNIKDNIKFSNPFFAHDEIGIGYAMDGLNTSFNDELSKLLTSYILFTGNIDDINIDGFKDFLKEEKNNSYRDNRNLFYPESDRIRNLVLMSMDEEFDYTEMMKYATFIKSSKDELKKMNINDALTVVFNKLCENHSLDDVINMMGNIDHLKESDFGSPSLYMLSKTYLTGELALDYLSSIDRKEVEKNSAKHI
ncbi:MAG: hypothetical protein IKF37_00115 [Bacilli bacterium]|nr:hypothetical protein [Bacilli bacterium]